jgi:hypothetical protein
MIHDHIYDEISELNNNKLVSDVLKNKILSNPPVKGLIPIKIDGKWYWEIKPRREREDEQLDYYIHRKPFAPILKEYCNFNCKAETHGSTRGWLNNFVIKYHITYDNALLIENWTKIIKKIKNKKIYKKSKECKEIIDNFKCSLFDYNTYTDFVKDREFLFDFATNFNTEYSIEIKYNITNKNYNNYTVQRHFASKMKNPVFKITEKNGWEHECWTVYFDYPITDHDFNCIIKLSNRFNELGSIDQKIGKTRYIVNLFSEELALVEDSIINHPNSCTYLPRKTICRDKIDNDKLLKLIQLNDSDLFEKNYKLGFIKELT